MTYSILFDCKCGFPINGGKAKFCERHDKIIKDLKDGQQIKMVMYRAGLGFIYNVWQQDGVIGFETKFQESLY